MEERLPVEGDIISQRIRRFKCGGDKMSRVVKNPIERRKEILNKASELFLNKGYDKTSVNNIVEDLAIAKGTFYHYFKSKEEVLCAILEESVERYSEVIKDDLCNLYGAGSKMQFVLRKLLIPSKDDSKDLLVYVEDDDDAKMHKMLEKKFYEKFQPILVGIMQEGIEEGIFNIKHPVEITEVLLLGVRAFMHIHIPKFDNPDYAKNKLLSLEELFNKILGSDNNTFTFRLFD